MMINRSIKVLAGAVLGIGLMTGGALAAGDAKELKSVDWHHSGPFGTYDRAQVQRGFQVYAEVCAACHGLKYIAYRNLMEIGFSEDQAKAIAAEKDIEDGPDAAGDMFTRAGRLSDKIPSPFPNDNAAKASNGGAYPPDLSLIAKARVGGENYLYSLLSGYEEDSHGHECPAGTYSNPYFAGGCLKMPSPIADDLIEYVDGTPATVDQMSKDVSAFLTWAAEPKMEERKAMGFKVIIFLLIMSGLLYAAKRRIWARLH